MAPQRVIFAHLAGHQSSGAKIMRCDQLAAMATMHLDPRRWTFEVLAMPREGQLRKQRLMTDEMRDAVVIFLKRAWKVIDPGHLAAWRGVSRGMAIDYVDARTTPQPSVEIDVHIAASGALERHLSAHHPSARIIRLDHHADPLLTRGAPQDRLRLAYFGRADNRTLPQNLENRVMTPAYDGLSPDSDVREAMRHANLHYAVREMEAETDRLSFKPFTKGFNAAAVGAHVLVNRQVDDAMDWLGPDYPFLIDDCRPDTIAAAIDKAETSYGSAEWTDALAAIETVRKAVRPKAITAQLEKILDQIVS
ncbi:MAG: hypothetical protein HKP37_11550 [Boseongicola sp.]|nr:hypothetical protein [Altererythrobacter sp.]NNL19364.1 hypothetical protein [Boseongicola sp.]